MGIYSEYLDSTFANFNQLTIERKNQLRRISQLRGNRDVLVYAADYNKGDAQISISFDDLLAINDQLSNLNGDALDIIIETPGGSGEVAEDIVKLLRAKYDDISVIVPGWTKSAGTIIAMSCNEILMEPASALGPIDAQLSREGRVYSADAFLKGMDEIKTEVERTGVLNKAYIPILQGVSPGDLQSAKNAMNFAKDLVKEWLVEYKFKNWNKHSTTGLPVTDDEKLQRAEEIALQLGNHSRWLTHGRSLKINDLEDMKLKINDYSKNNELADAIRRYYTLLKMSLDTNIYKIFETKDSQIYKSINNNTAEPQPPNNVPKDFNTASFDVQCPQCKTMYLIQANLEAPQPLEPGATLFPQNDVLLCQKCDNRIPLSKARVDIEAQTGKRIV
ncbi:SDH family Clp fold serine proteinase [Bacillus sp. UMB0893]|uniref:SDH family Clp fold serine proteinase n=1 Tax=Bacillus sp. UMB0893 TaxID=2066053 RepID=UPI000C772EDA|nr:Clp protease ClpP [Bacillus sp. UMB0893]PLR65977.1 Clp protease ClpP [Bacillus sp. UMB0893]